MYMYISKCKQQLKYIHVQSAPWNLRITSVSSTVYCHACYWNEALHTPVLDAYLVKICIVFMLHKLCIIPYILANSTAFLIVYFHMRSQCERTIEKLSVPFVRWGCSFWNDKQWHSVLAKRHVFVSLLDSLTPQTVIACGIPITNFQIWQTFRS